MKITFEKKVIREFTEDFNINELEVIKLHMRDSESLYLSICYRDVEIGGGHINLLTNTAHIDLYKDNEELEEYLTYGIECRIIPLTL
jgi:hypothetical protein